MKRLKLYSPAKINLYLKVLNKRPDGFHNISTVFERINLCDEITLTTRSSGIKIRCSHKDVPTNARNLVYKVAKMLKDDLGISKGVEINIKKRIPVAAGLGGGSGNAATVLMGLNKLWQLRLSQAKLVGYAQKIGSDVPFFLYNCSWAKGTGRGDKIKKLKIRQKLWHILVTPKVKVRTPKIYGGLNLKLTKNEDNANILIHNLKNSNILGVLKYAQNDLEKQVMKSCPSVQRLKQRLKSLNIQGVMVSGSGPSVFGIARSEREAKKLQSQLLKRFSRVFVVRTL